MSGDGVMLWRNRGKGEGVENDAVCENLEEEERLVPADA